VLKAPAVSYIPPDQRRSSPLPFLREGRRSRFWWRLFQVAIFGWVAFSFLRPDLNHPKLHDDPFTVFFGTILAAWFLAWGLTWIISAAIGGAAALLRLARGGSVPQPLPRQHPEPDRHGDRLPASRGSLDDLPKSLPRFRIDE